MLYVSKCVCVQVYEYVVCIVYVLIYVPQKVANIIMFWSKAVLYCWIFFFNYFPDRINEMYSLWEMYWKCFETKTGAIYYDVMRVFGAQHIQHYGSWMLPWGMGEIWQIK
jgi:hypothetical protein